MTPDEMNTYRADDGEVIESYEDSYCIMKLKLPPKEYWPKNGNPWEVPEPEVKVFYRIPNHAE